MKFVPKTIENLVRQAFSDTTVISCRPLEGDSANLNYVVQLQNPSIEIVLRIYHRDTPKPQLEKEMHVLRIVMPETGVPTARVIHFDDSRTIIDQPYAVFNLLPGESLEKALPRMDEQDQEAVGYEMGRYLARLHSIPLENFGQFLADDPLASTSEKNYTVARVMEWLQVCEKNALLDKSAVVALQRFVRQTHALGRREACFVHGSYHERNTTVQEGIAGFHVTGVFDFEHAQGWSPEWDMANLFGHVADRHPSLIRGFLDGYADTKSLPDNFWDRLEVYQQAVNICYVVRAYRTGDKSLLKVHQAQVHRFLANNFGDR